MRRGVLLLPLALVLAACGGARTVQPRPETVVGPIPSGETSPGQTTGAQTGTSGGTTTTSGGTTTTGGTSTSGGGASAADGKALFASNGCGACHTYQPAGAGAKIGPDLDKLAQYAKQAKQPLESFTRESIVNPNAYVQPGFQPIMPSFSSLSPAQVDALVAFLTKPQS